MDLYMFMLGFIKLGRPDCFHQCPWLQLLPAYWLTFFMSYKFSMALRHAIFKSVGSKREICGLRKLIFQTLIQFDI